MKISTIISAKYKKILRIIGPGVVTGASDDDPSGIATYSQAGAGFGLSTLWTALLTFPLMATIQEMCARIGLVTQEGLTTTIKRKYPKSILYLMVIFSFPATILNIGADLQGMGSIAKLFFPGIPLFIYCIIFAILIIFFIIKFNYEKIASKLKWLCLTLFLYAIVPFIINVSWSEILKATFIPTIQFNKRFFEILVAILGTTISPYLFFWQTNMEAEDITHKKNIIIVNRRVLKEMKWDVDIGMLFSNIIMFFIILTTGAVLFKGGIRNIETVEQAANALRPLTGKYSYLLFGAGIIGTGFLAIPVLVGSLSYILAETFNWEKGLDKKFHEAKGFYITFIFSLIVGLSLGFLGISPIQALIYSAVLYGITSPIMIVIIMHICNNKEVMGKYTNKKWSNILGTIILALMSVSAAALIYFQFMD